MAITIQPPSHCGERENAMSKFEKELLRRLANGEDVQKTAMWFIKKAIEANLANKDLSAFEARFMKRIDEAYAQWKANRKVH